MNRRRFVTPRSPGSTTHRSDDDGGNPEGLHDLDHSCRVIVAEPDLVVIDRPSSRSNGHQPLPILGHKVSPPKGTRLSAGVRSLHNVRIGCRAGPPSARWAWSARTAQDHGATGITRLGGRVVSHGDTPLGKLDPDRHRSGLRSGASVQTLTSTGLAELLHRRRQRSL
jgi:hypothetical protein